MQTALTPLDRILVPVTVDTLETDAIVHVCMFSFFNFNKKEIWYKKNITC